MTSASPTGSMIGIGVLIAMASCGQEYDVVDDFEVDPVEILPCGFTPVSGTRVSVYDCNPVFSGVDEAWSDGFDAVAFRSQTVLGHPVFQVWYTSALAGVPSGWALGHAVSSNGIDWEPHPSNPVFDVNRLWNAHRAGAMSVAWNGADEEYAIAYQGTNLAEGSFGLGVLTSSNGVAWTEGNSGASILDLTSSGYCWPLGLSWEEDRGYVGYLAVRRGSLDIQCEAHRYETTTFEVQDIDVEDEHALRAGPRSYDASGVASVATVIHEGTWYMFYVGFRTWENVEGYDNVLRTLDRTLNLATSTDGVSWVKDADNPLPIGLASPGRIGTVGAQVIGSRIHVWATDHYADIDQSAVGYFLFEPTRLHP